MDWWHFINEYRVGICVFLAVAALLFICIGHKYRDEVQSKLKGKFFDMPSTPIDYWSLSHFVLYAIFGFLIPDHPLSFLMLGAGFELAEDALSSRNSTQLADCSKNPDGKLWCNLGLEDDYWYANASDVYVNLFGYVVGSAIRTVLF